MMLPGRRLIAMAAVLGVFLLWSPALLTAAPDKNALPPALTKITPDDVKDLRAIEEQVQKVLDKAIPATVGVRIGPGWGSGVIVSEDGYVLTAGHVSGTPGQKAQIILPDGKKLEAKALGRNTSIDSGMLKITEPGKYPFVEMGHSSELKKGSWVVAVGHPGGWRANRTPVVRLGRVLFVDPRLLRTDCTLVGGDSGGPLFDMNGKVVGIHSRIGGSSITENLHVPVDTYRETWAKLTKGENWGGQLGENVVQSAGGKIVFERKALLKPSDPRDPQREECRIRTFIVPLKAGCTYTFDLRSRQFDAFLRLEDANGRLLGEDDDSAGKTDARILYRALRDEECKVVVSSFEPGVGKFVLEVREADARDTYQGGNLDVLRTLKLHRLVVLELLKQAKGMQVTAALVDDAGKPAAGKKATVSWEQGRAVVEADADGMVRWTLEPDRLKKLTLELPDGTRALVGLLDAKGAPVLPRLQGDNDPTRERVKSAGGEVVLDVKANLTTQDPRDSARAECHRKQYDLQVSAGHTYTIELQSEEIDPYLRLEDAQGKQLAEDDDGAGFLNSRIVYRAEQDGALRIVATSCDPGQTGAYHLIVRRSKSSSPTNETPK